ncbi:hypothetical protein Mame01_15330 [Microbispora amethystogenes]|nr:hypothetical protein Mame01_15330 [Microbispora amethystogenes]
MSAWQEVRDLVTARETKTLADCVIALTEAERAEVARRLPGLLKEMRDTATRMTHGSRGVHDLDDEDWWTAWERRRTVRGALAELGAPLRIAGAGTISGPAAAAAWLTRRELYPEWGPAPDPAEVVRVLVTRPAGWQADVAARLAGKIRRADDVRIAPLVLALLRASGVTPPAHDPLVVAWLTGPAADDDPLLGPLLPLIFEAEGAGRALREERLTPSPTPWLSLIGRLLRTGRVSRGELLDGCVSRFLRGGDAADLRFFVRLHELVEPAPQEAAGRVRDYLRLLPAAPGPVAELALTQVDRTGPHDDADVQEAIEALTFRPEAKLARAGLSRLDQEVRRRPTRAGELAPALVTALAHTSDDVRRRAVRIALRHAAAFRAEAKSIADAVPLLPADLGRELAAVFGGDVTAEGTPEPFTPAPLPVLPEPGPFPAPSVDHTTWDLREWVAREQWLAGFVERAGRDRAALRATLAPVFQDFSPHLYDMESWLDPDAWIAALAKEVIAPGTDPGVPDPESAGLGLLVGITYSALRRLFGEPERPDPVVDLRRRSRLPEPAHVSPPHMFLLHRLDEVYRALREGALPPVLLATPTVMTGHLDPRVLVDRLELCAAAGVEPLPADLQQALLRLPRGTHPFAAERAAHVRSQAAPAVAAWLAQGGLPDPEAGLKWGYIENAHEYLFEERDPGHVEQVRLVPVLRAEPTGHHLIDELLREPSKWRWDDHGHVMASWPSILPSHREVVSVNFLPHLLHQWNHPGVYPAYLEAVADADGPLGEATALIMAYFLADRRPDPVPVLLRMTSRGDLPAEAIGRQLALLLRRTWFETRPVLASLREAAHQGAHEQVWEILRALLPDLLPSAGERPNVTQTEAVALAADVAAWVGARGEIPAVSAHAPTGRPSRRSRFARECARLCDQLAG